MIAETDRKTIEDLARKYHAKRVVLFGSSLSSGDEYRDIDIGVEGVREEDFFAFYGDLMCALSKPVDVVDLSATTRFVELIRQAGVCLCG
jgi:predicted nucleotidyltransferase